MSSSPSSVPREEGVLVAIRMRPLNSNESTGQSNRVWRVNQNYNSVTQCTNAGKPLPERTFFYEKTFDESSTTREIYEHTSRGIVESVPKGINGTIFAYGQTNSGKTFTMQGSGDGNGGIVHMAASDIFEHIKKDPERVFSVRASFVEIYNEAVRDLLVSGDGNDDAKLTIREDEQHNVFVDSNETVVTSIDKLLSVLFEGQKKRSVAATGMNERSSRSHAIFRITVESSLREAKIYDNEEEKDSFDETLCEDDTEIKVAARVSTLNLVDLAGSENARHTGATGDRQKEGGMINTSLLTLSRVIESRGQNDGHVSYRDSKLTHILKPSLSGNARMAMICCATPSKLYLKETRSTLQFASSAKLVKTRAQVNNVLDDQSLIKKLRRELKEARRELEEGWRGGTVSEATEQVKLLKEQMSELQATVEALRGQLASKEEKNFDLNEQVKGLHTQLASKEEEHSNALNALNEQISNHQGDTAVKLADVVVKLKAAAEYQTSKDVEQIMSLENENRKCSTLQRDLDDSANKANTQESRIAEAKESLKAREVELLKLKNDASSAEKEKKMYHDALALNGGPGSNEKTARLEIENKQLRKQMKKMQVSGAAAVPAGDQGEAVAALQKQLIQKEVEVAKLVTSKKRLEAYMLKTLKKFEDKYLTALQDCRAKLKAKCDEIEALEMRVVNQKVAQKREAKLLSSAIFELGLGIMKIEDYEEEIL